VTATDRLQRDLTTSYRRYLQHRRARRRTIRIAALATAAALVATGASLGAATLLGWPAPEHVKKEIAAVDRGLPADLRLNPDVENARAVASNGSSTLYAAALRDGGRCTELVTAGGRGRGATCSTATDQRARAIDVTVPFDDGAGGHAPVVLAGRVNAPSTARLEIAYADGATDAIPFGDDRYFVFEVPQEQLGSAHGDGLDLVARDDEGSVVARATVPADWDDAAVPDEQAPLFASTRSDESDFTKVFGIEGHVGAAGAVKLELSYGDGEVPIPIAPDGSFDYTVPPERVDDFMQPRALRALDTEGHVVASTYVAAVAYWRGAERR
jgi:hypothetical protein